MRFFVPFVALSAIVGVIARPVSRQTEEQQVADAVSQATQNAEAFNQNLQRIIGLIKSDPLLELKPYTFDIPKEFESSLSTAVSGIASLPTLTPSTDIPQYAADYFGPLVNSLEVVFYTLLDLKVLSQKIVNDPRYTNFSNDLDSGTYIYVMNMNSKFEGVTCQLAKQYVFILRAI